MKINYIKEKSKRRKEKKRGEGLNVSSRKAAKTSMTNRKCEGTVSL